MKVNDSAIHDGGKRNRQQNRGQRQIHIRESEARPFNSQLQFSWMRWRDYSGGEMTNWGAHGVDQIQWALGMSETGPVDDAEANTYLSRPRRKGFELPESS